jgi:mono/diheme cytochrome c family protein
MNTSKQINIIVILIFVSLIATGAYTIWDPDRADRGKDEQLEATLERGAYLFSANCRICHGDSGEGGQAANRLREAPALNRPDLQGKESADAEADTQAKAQAYRLVFNTITCGRVGRAMPAWAQAQGGTLNDEQIRQLATFITEGTAWEEAHHFALEGYPPSGIHGDAEVAFTLVEPIGGEDTDTQIFLSDVSVLGPGERLQFGEELVLITAVHVPGVTVERAAGGTSAARHESGATILVNGQAVGLTLGRVLNDSATEIPLASVEGLQDGDELRIDNETLTVTDVNRRHYVEVERGLGSTQASEHGLDAEILKPPVPPDPPAINESACGQIASASGPTPTPQPPGPTLTISALPGNTFDKPELFGLPGIELTLTHDNTDTGVAHNWELFVSEDAVTEGEAPIVSSDLEPGPVTQTITFGPLQAGEYYYQCVAHPGSMFGILYVQEATAAPAVDATPAAGTTPAAGEATPAATATPPP